MPRYTIRALPSDLTEDARRVSIERGLAVDVSGQDAPYPVRCCLRDAGPHEQVLLLSAQPITETSPYAATGPIYLHRHPCDGYRHDGQVPEMLRSRLLSVRAFDDAHMMTGAEVMSGDLLDEAAPRLLAVGRTAYRHVHFAGAGCYACRIDPAT